MRWPEPLWLWVIVAALASWRLASIAHREGIFRPVRRWLGIGEEGGVITYPETFLGELFSCLWCLSVWTGTLCTVLLFVFPHVLLPFALSALAIGLERAVEHD